MVTDGTVNVVFVVAPYTEAMKAPRSFALRLSRDGLEALNSHIDAGDVRSYRFTCGDGSAYYLKATARRSPYGFVQLKPEID